ncbi:MAG: hypothetical protein QXP84_03125 [Candidatus Korarchaeum sp.]
MRKALYILLPFLIALSFRIYPTLLSGLPFSTDAWPLIRNAEQLVRNTPVYLGNKDIFDGYNNYWPASSIFGAILSETLGASVVTTISLGIPLAATLSILIFYVLTNKLYRNHELAFLASAVLAVAFPYAIFTAGVTKETYAHPIYVLSILVFLNREFWKRIIIFTTVSAALIMTHHLTSVIILAILINITLHKTVSGFLMGSDINKIDYIMVSIMGGINVIYFAMYAHMGLKLVITAGDWLSAWSYQTIALVMALYLSLKPYRPSGTWIFLKCAAATALTSAVFLLLTKRSVVPGAPILPSSYIIYALPFIIASSLTVLGLRGSSDTESGYSSVPLLWILSVLGFEGYAIFGGSPISFVLAYRALNFLWPPLALTCALGIHRISSISKSNGGVSKFLAIVLLAFLLIPSCLGFYSAISLQERYLGYFWLYREQEYSCASWISEFNDRVLAGDVKFAYLLEGYFSSEVDELQGLMYLSGMNSSKPAVLLTYDGMSQNGYVLYGGISIELPRNWREILSDLNFIYSNGYVNVYSNGS